MGLQNHTLQIGNSTSATLADLGIVDCVVDATSAGDDKMTLTLPRSMQAADLIPAFTRVILRDWTNTIRFTGWCLDPRGEATGNKEERRYTILGPQALLRGKVFRQRCKIPADPTVFTTTFVDAWNSDVILNRWNDAGTSTMKVADQIVEALEWFILAWAGYSDATIAGLGYAAAVTAAQAGAPITWDVSQVADLYPPGSQAQSRFCWDVIRDQMRWMPLLACRWLYNTSDAHPILHFHNNRGTAVNNAGNAVISSDVVSRVLDVTAGNVTGWNWTARPDILLSRVRITWVAYIENVEPGDSDTVRYWRKYVVDDSTQGNGSFFEIDQTIELQPGQLLDDGTFAVPEEAPASGLAASMHAPFKTLSYDFEWKTKGQEVNWDPLPGELWKAVNAAPELSNQWSMCQSISRDIRTGTTSFKCGTPTHLGLDDKLALVRADRLRRLHRHLHHGMGMSAVPASTSGDGSVKNDKPPGHQRKTAGLPLCDGNTVNVFVAS